MNLILIYEKNLIESVFINLKNIGNIKFFLFVQIYYLLNGK